MYQVALLNDLHNKSNPYICKHDDTNCATKHMENKIPKDPWLEMVTLAQSEKRSKWISVLINVQKSFRMR